MYRLLLALILLCTAAVHAQQSSQYLDYIDQYQNLAVDEMNMYGIPASITLAQGLLESGCGNSSLCNRSNNHFGIKCHGEWNGGTVRYSDDAPNECFRAYKSPADSYRDHSEFLVNHDLYAPLFKLDITDYQLWAKGLRAAGYATDPGYANKIIKLIETYQLYKFDKPLSTDMAHMHQEDGSMLLTDPAQRAAAMQRSGQILLPKLVLNEIKANGLKAIKYQPRIPVTVIAQQYGITIEQLYTLNDIQAGEHFKEGEMVYLEKKNTESIHYQYEVAAGETMHDVAQKYGISLDELYRRNELARNCEPLAGEVVVLRGDREFPMQYRIVANRTMAKTNPTPDTKNTVANNND